MNRDIERTKKQFFSKTNIISTRPEEHESKSDKQGWMEEECEHGQSHIHIRTQIFFITFILQAALKISLLLKSQYIYLKEI